MSDNELFKAGQEQGMMLAEMKEMRKSIDGLTQGLSEFKKSSWERIEKHGEAIGELKINLGNIAKEVDKLESAKTWIIRTVGALILTGLIGLIYKVR